MPIPFKLRQIEKQFGEPLEILIPRMIEQHGTIHKAAVALDVYPNTIRNWQKRHPAKATARR